MNIVAQIVTMEVEVKLLDREVKLKLKLFPQN